MHPLSFHVHRSVANTSGRFFSLLRGGRHWRTNLLYRPVESLIVFIHRILKVLVVKQAPVLFCERASEPEENSHYRVSYCFARARYWIPRRPLAAKQREREQERPGEKRERGAVGSDKETLKEAERERERERGRPSVHLLYVDYTRAESWLLLLQRYSGGDIFRGKERSGVLNSG